MFFIFEKYDIIFTDGQLYKILMNWIFRNKNLPCENLRSRIFRGNKNSIQNKKTKTLSLVLFLMFATFIFSGILFFGVKHSAAIDKTGQCVCTTISSGNIDVSTVARATTGSAGCESYCKEKYYKDDPSANDFITSSFTAASTQAELDQQAKAVVAATPPAIKKTLGFFAQAFVDAISWVLTQVQSVMVKLFSVAATLFAVVVDPVNISGTNGLLNKQAVKDVWIMVRDALNMFFILILLFSAFCTIFQVEKWNLKAVWLRILINALLVNFSYPIARFFIDVSNVAMYYFINNMFTSSSGTVTGSTIMSSFGSESRLAFLLQPTNYVNDSIAFQIAMIIFTFVLGMTLLIVAILFVIRLVALAMLIMFSPIGFVGYIFPSTMEYADKWWKQLFSYSFFGPIMIAIMAIALQVANAMGNDNFASFRGYAGVNSANDQSSWIASAAFYAIPIVILWMGMGVAKSMGIAGADTVVGNAQKFGKWAGALPFRGAWAVTKAGGRKFDRDVMKSWSPRAFLKGWQANAESKEAAHLGGATGAWRDRINKALFDGTTHYKDMEEENFKGKELKEMEAYATNDEYLLSEIRSLKGKTDSKSQARVAAAVSMMFRNNDQNEFMKHFGADGKGGNRDPASTKNALLKLFKETGMNDNQIGRNLYQLGEIGLSKGNLGDYGMGKFDATLNNNKGGYRVTGDDEQLAAAKAKFVNIGSQEKMKSMHWNSILSENQNGTTGDVHEIGKAFLKSITAAEIEQVGRARADFLKRMIEAKDKIEEFRNSKNSNNEDVCSEEQKAMIKKLMEKIESVHNDKGK
jgi:hypothetical protein